MVLLYIRVGIYSVMGVVMTMVVMMVMIVGVGVTITICHSG